MLTDLVSVLNSRGCEVPQINFLPPSRIFGKQTNKMMRYDLKRDIVNLLLDFELWLHIFNASFTKIHIVVRYNLLQF